MRICLVSMPWGPCSTPQMSLGALTAYVRQHAPSYQIEPRYESLAVWEQMPKDYEYLNEKTRSQSELIYLGHLFPERKEVIKQQLLDAPAKLQVSEGQFVEQKVISQDLFESSYRITGQHLNDLAEDLARQPYSVIGCSVSFDQLFSSLALCKLVKEKNSKAITVFGGFIASSLSRSILQEFSFVDYVIPGEAETVFLEFLRGIEQGKKQFDIKSGVLTSNNLPPTAGTERNLDPAHLPDLESLPIPDFLGYAEHAERLGINWVIPIESSRGCWWRRVEATKNPFDACYFCSYAAGNFYREKSSEHVADEMRQQTEKYQRVEFFFTDSVLRKDKVTELAKQIQSKNKQFVFTLEGRSIVAPSEIMALKDAGCYRICLGIEGFSDSYLKRLNKGTTVIRNLQTLKTCYELEVQSESPLIYHAPGTTQEEINESISNILSHAICFDSLVDLIPFFLVMDSTIFVRPDFFNIGEIKLRKDFRSSLPPDLEKRLIPYWAEFSDYNPTADYSGLFDAVAKWRKLHEQLKNNTSIMHSFFRKPLYYFDEGTYLMVVDQRKGFEEITLEEAYREIYLYCMRIRSRREILERFGSKVAAEKIEQEILPSLTEKQILYSSNHLFLSLAAAYKPEIAANRIRQDFA